MDKAESRLYIRTGNKLVLGIGREYTNQEKTIVLKVAKEHGFNVPKSCAAGIYHKFVPAETEIIKLQLPPIDRDVTDNITEDAILDELSSSLDLLYMDYERMSTSGQQTYDKICSLLAKLKGNN